MKSSRHRPESSNSHPDRAIELERVIADLAEDVASETIFLHALASARIWILVDKDNSGATHWNPKTNFLVLADDENDDGSVEMLATFSSPEFMTSWPDRFPEFSFGMQLDFHWIEAHLPEGMGVILNPASALEVRIAPELFDDFKQRQ